MMNEVGIYERQGFGNQSGFGKQPALLIVDFVNANSDAGSIVKCCYQNVQHAQSLHIFQAAFSLSEGETRVALMGQGPGGDWTRIHAPMLKQALVYTTLDRDYSLVKRGQVNINDLRTAWNVLEYE